MMTSPLLEQMFERSISFDIRSNKKERYLSVEEETYFKPHYMNPPLAVYFQSLVLKSRIEIHVTEIREVFFKLSKYHDLLRASVKEDNNRLLFYFDDSLLEHDNWIKIDSIDNVQNPVSNWIEIAESKVDGFRNDLISGNTLWKLVWLTYPKDENNFNYVLIFIASHVIVDARSATDLLHNQFLPLLNKHNVFDKENKLCSLPYPNNAIFSHQKDYKNHLYGSNVLSKPLQWCLKFFVWCKTKMSDIPKMRVYNKFVENSNSVCHHTFSIDEENSRNFINICKERSVTVHTVISMLVSNAFNNAEGKFENFNFTEKAFLHSVDCRKFNQELQESPMTLGVYVTTVKLSIDPVPLMPVNYFFKQASSLTQKIKSENNPMNVFKFEAVVETLLNNYDIETIFKNIVAPSLMISNAGVVKTAQLADDPVQVTEQYFSVGMSSRTFTGLFLSLSTLNNKIFFCLGFDKHWFSLDFAKFIGNDIQASITTLIERHE